MQPPGSDPGWPLSCQLRLTRTSGSVGGLGRRPPRSTRPKPSQSLCTAVFATEKLYGQLLRATAVDRVED